MDTLENAPEFHYRSIVFRLTGGKLLNDSLPVKKLLHQRSCIISEHPDNEDEDCQWNDLHYHGIVEHPAKYRFDGDRIFNTIKSNHCQFFKSEQCKLPVNFLAYMQIPPRKIVFESILNDASDLPILSAQITPELIEQVKQRKQTRTETKKKEGRDIQNIKELILKHGVQSENELLDVMKDNLEFEDMYCKRTFNLNFQKALAMAQLEYHYKDIISCCQDYHDQKDLCMTPQRSVAIMERWLEHQNIDKREFVISLIDTLDLKTRKRATFYMQGEPNSGKTFIVKSICKAVRNYGEVTQGIQGYTFMWQDCCNKKLIVLNEPFFDYCVIEKVKIIMEATGTYVPAKNRGEQYLKPTPVIITSNNDVWAQCPSAKGALLTRCRAYYNNLKSAPFLARVRKDLHPMWLPLLYSKLKIDYAVPVPISDFSDDECPSTSLVIDTADRELTSSKVTKKEDQSTNLIDFAENTTSTSAQRGTQVKRQQIENLDSPPIKKECSGIFSPLSSTDDIIFPSYQVSTSSYLGRRSICPKEETRRPQITRNQEPPTIFDLIKDPNQEDTLTSQDLFESDSILVPDSQPWPEDLQNPQWKKEMIKRWESHQREAKQEGQEDLDLEDKFLA